MRTVFSQTLVRLAQDDPDVLLLTGDHGYALFDDFRRLCPRQYINAGVAEQNMVGMAAGLSRLGFRPFVYGLSAFIPVRVLEQIKLDVAHDDLPVVFLGDGAGLVYSHLGTSHQSTEDIACTRAIPGLSILSPADRHEMEACMRSAYHDARPVYLRIGKSDLGDVHRCGLDGSLHGGILQIDSGPNPADVALIATGSMVQTAIRMLRRGLSASVWSAPQIKPLGAEKLREIARSHSGIVVLEEHSIHGGLGSAIAEAVTEQSPIRVLRIGIRDRFSHSCGSYTYLLEEHGLDENSVWNSIQDWMSSFRS